jgi:hypothetical protein
MMKIMILIWMMVSKPFKGLIRCVGKIFKNFFHSVEVDEDAASHDTSGRNEYKKMCSNLSVVPCSYFMAHVEDQTLVLKFHQFSSDEIRALSKPLWVCFKL